MIDFHFGCKLMPMSSLEPEVPYKWRNDPFIYTFCRQYEPLEYGAHLDWFNSLKNRSGVKMYAIGIETSENINTPIGVCGLTDLDLINRKAEFSLYIAPGWQGSGHGKSALKTLCAHGFMAMGLQHIFGETFDGNSAAKMFEKVGFKKEGTRRKFYYRHGQFIDAHIYSILAEEFREKWSL